MAESGVKWFIHRPHTGFFFTPKSRERRKQAMLMGEYNHSLDAKGRIIVPSRLRDQLGESF